MIHAEGLNMGDEAKENGQTLEDVKPLSAFEEKMKGLLDELDELMEKVGGDYGPILMEELQNLQILIVLKNIQLFLMFMESLGDKWL